MNDVTSEVTAHEAWLEARRQGVGGSDIGAMFNLEPYGCQRMLWYDKRNQEPDYPRKEGGVLDRGHALEPVIAEQFTKDYGLKVRNVNQIKQHKTEHWALANLDRKVEGEDILLECKTAGREIFHRIKRDGIPEHYIMQVQQYLWITGYKKAILAILWADGWKFLYEEIEADPNIHRLIQDTGRWFWRMVTEGGIPDRLDPNDKRCQTCIFRTTCQGQALLDKIDDATGEEIVDMSNELDPLMEDLVNVEGVLLEAKGMKEELTTKIKAVLNKTPVANCTGYRVHFRPHKRTSVQSAKLKKEQPDIYEKYSSTSVVRPLRKYPI